MSTIFKNKIDSPNRFLWYQFSKMCNIEGFNLSKYKDMKVENQYYVYDKMSLLQGIICGATDKMALREVKKYILRKAFLNLLWGGDDHNFNAEAKRQVRREEWANLFEFIKFKLTGKV